MEKLIKLIPLNIVICLFFFSGCNDRPKQDVDDKYLNWKFECDGAISSSFLLVDNIIYLGSADDTDERAGYLYAIDATTGLEIWRFKTNEAVLFLSIIQRSI